MKTFSVSLTASLPGHIPDCRPLHPGCHHLLCPHGHSAHLLPALHSQGKLSTWGSLLGPRPPPLSAWLRGNTGYRGARHKPTQRPWAVHFTFLLDFSLDFCERLQASFQWPPLPLASCGSPSSLYSVSWGRSFLHCLLDLDLNKGFRTFPWFSKCKPKQHKRDKWGKNSPRSLVQGVNIAAMQTLKDSVAATALSRSPPHSPPPRTEMIFPTC